MTGLVFWLMAALLGAVGLHAIAPRRAPLLYLGPALCTTAVLTLAVVYVAAVWSH